MSAKNLIATTVGTGIHDQMQSLFYRMGMLEGVYKCIRCGHEFWATAPQQCPECLEALNWSKMKFLEVPMNTGILRGHADGLLNINGFRKLLEIKSIKNQEDKTSRYGFELVVRQPMDDHYMQTQLYLDMWKETVKESKNGTTFELLPEKAVQKVANNSPVMNGARVVGDIEEGVVLYVAKNTSELRLFIVKRNYNSITYLMDVMRKIWKAYLVDDVDSITGLCYTDSAIQRSKCKYRKEICKL